jgi:hypothetical protein
MIDPLHAFVDGAFVAGTERAIPLIATRFDKSNLQDRYDTGYRGTGPIGVHIRSVLSIFTRVSTRSVPVGRGRPRLRTAVRLRLSFCRSRPRWLAIPFSGQNTLVITASYGSSIDCRCVRGRT